MKRILMKKPFSHHPEDTHLSVVLVAIEGRPFAPGLKECEPVNVREFVVWSHNAQQGAEGYYNGQYFRPTPDGLRAAVESFCERGVQDEAEQPEDLISVI